MIKKVIIVYSISVLVIAGISGVTVFYYLGKNKDMTATNIEMEINTNMMKDVRVIKNKCEKKLNNKNNREVYIESGTEFKKLEIYYGNLISEIPSSWKLVINDEHYCNASDTPSNSSYSFSPDDIIYIDIAWRQVDICVDDENLEKSEGSIPFNPQFINEIGCWGEEFLLKLNSKADVFYEYTEKDGSVSKGNPGGKIYFIAVPELNKTVIIKKQARGDDEYEAYFDNFINNLAWVK